MSPRQAAAHNTLTIIRPDVARKVIEWRDSILRELMNLGEKKTHRKDAVLKTLLPELGSVNASLLRTMPDICRASQEHPEWNLNQVCDFACAQAQFETSTNPSSNHWRRTVRLLWQIESFLKENFARLRGPEPVGRFVREMIGSQFGASAQTVQNALRDRTRTKSPDEMRSLIVGYTSNHPNRPMQRGPQPMALADRAFFQIGKQVDEQIPLFQRLIAARRLLPKGVRDRKRLLIIELSKAGFSQEQIDAGISAKEAVIGARHFISRSAGLEYSIVAKYHRQSQRPPA